MTAFQHRQAIEAAQEHRKANPIIGLLEFGTRQDELMGKAGYLKCVAKADGRFLIQLRRGGCLPFQKIYQTKEAAREGWKIGKAMI